MSNLRRSKIPGWYEYTREVCPICNKTGGCMIHENGEKVVCIRNQSKVQFSVKFPSWIHNLVEPKKVTKANFVQGNKKVGAASLNKAYGSLLAQLTLEEADCMHLMNEKRKMSREQIEIRGYKTTSEKPWITVKQMAKHMQPEELKGVPGFYQNEFGWSFTRGNGFFIPYRNERNQIIGFQLRADVVPNEVKVIPGSFDNLQARVIEQPNLVQIIIDGEIIEEVRLEKNDNAYGVYQDGKYGHVSLVDGQKYFWFSSANKPNGTGAGDPLPYHVAVPTEQLKYWQSGNLHSTKAVWITEGGLKADIAAEHIKNVYDAEELMDVGSTVIGTPGINTWRTILPALEEMGVERVNVAIDMDVMSNPDVRYHSLQMMEELKRLGYLVNIAIWNEADGKGIDDIFTIGKFPHLKRC